MSYPKELDEYSNEEIKKEYFRRQTCIIDRVCFYCLTPLVGCKCKISHLHKQALKNEKYYEFFNLCGFIVPCSGIWQGI